METSETVNKMPVERRNLLTESTDGTIQCKRCPVYVLSSCLGSVIHHFWARFTIVFILKDTECILCSFLIPVWTSEHVRRLEITRSSNSLIVIYGMLNLLWMLLECSADSYHQSVCLQVVLLFMVQCLNQISCEWRWDLERRPVSSQQSPAPALTSSSLRQHGHLKSRHSNNLMNARTPLGDLFDGTNPMVWIVGVFFRSNDIILYLMCMQWSPKFCDYMENLGIHFLELFQTWMNIQPNLA